MGKRELPKLITPCTYKEGSIKPDDPGEVARFKNSLTDGVRLQMTLENLPSKRSKQAFNLFHALVAAYCKDQGTDREQTKMAFKMVHGVTYPVEHGLTSKRHGQIVEDTDGKFYFVVSTNEYSVSEMYTLIRGTINECLDAMTDIEDIMQEWRCFKVDEVS